MFSVSVFTGARGRGHVAGRGGLLGGSSRARARAGLLVLLGRRIEGLELLILILILLELGERGARLGVLEAFLHLAETLLEGREFLGVSVDIALPVNGGGSDFGLDRG